MDVYQNSPDLLILTKEVEELADSNLETEAGFNKIYDYINKSLGKIKMQWDEAGNITDGNYQLGKKTALRLFRKETYSTKFSTDSLSMLAKAAGYKGWQDFLDNSKIKRDISLRFNNHTIDVNSLKDGEEIIVGWHPAKYSKLKHLKDWCFEVLENVGMNKPVGEQFVASAFTVGKDIPDSIYPEIIAEGIDYGNGDYIKDTML